MIDPAHWHEQIYNELGPLVINDHGQYMQLTREMAEELRHVESIPVSAPPQKSGQSKNKIVTNASPVDGWFPFQMLTRTVQIFNGSEWTFYLTSNPDVFGSGILTDYDFYVPPYSLAILLEETDYMAYHLKAAASPSGNQEIITVTGFTRQEVPSITAAGKP